MMEVVLKYELDESGKETGKYYYMIIDGRGRILSLRFGSFNEALAWIENVQSLAVNGVQHTDLSALFDNIVAKAREEHPHALAEDALSEVLETLKRVHDLLLKAGMIEETWSDGRV